MESFSKVSIFGVLGDRFDRGACAAIILIGMLLCGLALGLLGSSNFTARPGEALFVVSLVAFLLIEPYSYLAGAIALDFGGGKCSGATACGIIDGVGYLFGGVMAGKVIASLSVSLGWQGVFKILAVVALLTSLATAFFLANQLRPTRLVLVPLVLDGEYGKLKIEGCRASR
jgi:sugar phosphate permease